MRSAQRLHCHATAPSQTPSWSLTNHPQAAIAEEQQRWLRDAAIADERGFDPSATPRHTRDELVGEFQSDMDTLMARANVYDAQDAGADI